MIVPFTSASAAINPIVNDMTVRPSSKLRAPDSFRTKREMKPFMQALPDGQTAARIDEI